MLSPVWNRISLTTQKQSPEPTPEQAQKQDLRLFLKVVHQEIKLEMIVWPRIYLFRDHGSTKFTSLDQILSNINLGVLNPKIIVLSMFEIENINEALTYSDWTIAIQEELHKF